MSIYPSILSSTQSSIHSSLSIHNPATHSISHLSSIHSMALHPTFPSQSSLSIHPLYYPISIHPFISIPSTIHPPIHSFSQSSIYTSNYPTTNPHIRPTIHLSLPLSNLPSIDTFPRSTIHSFISHYNHQDHQIWLRTFYFMRHFLSIHLSLPLSTFHPSFPRSTIHSSIHSFSQSSIHPIHPTIQPPIHSSFPFFYQSSIHPSLAPQSTHPFIHLSQSSIQPTIQPPIHSSFPPSINLPSILLFGPQSCHTHSVSHSIHLYNQLSIHQSLPLSIFHPSIPLASAMHLYTHSVSALHPFIHPTIHPPIPPSFNLPSIHSLASAMHLTHSFSHSIIHPTNYPTTYPSTHPSLFQSYHPSIPSLCNASIHPFSHSSHLYIQLSIQPIPPSFINHSLPLSIHLPIYSFIRFIVSPVSQAFSHCHLSIYYPTNWSNHVLSNHLSFPPVNLSTNPSFSRIHPSIHSFTYPSISCIHPLTNQSIHPTKSSLHP